MAFNDLQGLTLVIPEKADIERDSVARAWRQRGGEVLRLGRFWDPPPLDPANARVYGNDTFCLVLAQKLGLELIQPDDALLVQLPARLLKRRVTAMPLQQARDAAFPLFMKSAVPKLFRAAVYNSADELERECKGLEAETVVLVSAIVGVEAEARCFVLEGKVLDCALYEGHQSPESAWEFARAATAELDLPASCVMDVGHFRGLGWGVIEFNATWGAGLNGCDADRVYPAIERASAWRAPPD